MRALLQTPLPALNDREADRLPQSLPAVVDAHVHLFPDHLFQSIWQWFDQYGWPVRYRLKSAEIVEFLLSRGISRIVGLHYAHRPGVARELNIYMSELCRLYPQLTGMATVYPGEKDTDQILTQAFDAGLAGVKLHCHVQCFDMRGDGMHEIYRICQAADKPIIMHVGREPKSPAYPCDPYELCSAERLERVLAEYPDLRICVPHLGADEFDAYQRLIAQYENLWLDTTMTLADYLPFGKIPDLAAMRADRLMYGSDFPNLPYAWDREIQRILRLNLNPDRLLKLCGQNAMDFYRISMKAT
ncbi:MAG: amidohydrolase [Deltaproteobacteria bacterium]|jgi:predicted TIM-barrel fold metal-dependent hydrolase|nr:amidohydrolase [Deltaproteobacteria bacterium]